MKQHGCFHSFAVLHSLFDGDLISAHICIRRLNEVCACACAWAFPRLLKKLLNFASDKRRRVYRVVFGARQLGASVRLHSWMFKSSNISLAAVYHWGPESLFSKEKQKHKPVFILSMSNLSYVELTCTSLTYWASALMPQPGTLSL